MQWLDNEQFGNGADGSRTVSIDATETEIDSAATGTIATTSLTATNVSFSANQIILIHQTQGTGVGHWELNAIASYSAGTITTKYPLAYTYASGAQVKVMKQYTNVTLNSGITLTAKTYDGTVGGLAGFVWNGVLTGPGTISLSGKGFRGGSGHASGTDTALGDQGESELGAGSASNSANNGTAGGGAKRAGGSGGAGGGGHLASGDNGSGGDISSSGRGGGSASDSADLTNAQFGGSGGGSASNSGEPGPYAGGNSGGFGVFIGRQISSGTSPVVVNAGQAPSGSSSAGLMGAGGGAGGSTIVKTQSGNVASWTASGGTGGTGESSSHNGGNGSDGRITVYAPSSSSVIGTSTPTYTFVADNNLANNFMGSMI